MSVGIVLNNDDNGVIIVDSRVSTNYRESDSVNKIETFKKRYSHGVVFGSGSGNLVLSLNKKLKELDEKNIEDLINRVHHELVKRIDKKDKTYLENIVNEYEKINSSLYVSKRKIFRKLKGINLLEKSDREKINYLTEKMMKKYDEILDKDISEIKSNYFDRKRNNKTEFITVMFDSNLEKIRKYHLDYVTKEEVFFDYEIIGSGKDYAHSYLSENLVGNNVGNFSLEDLIHFGINSYSKSTLNRGVGGIPKVYILNSEKVKKLNRDQSIELSYISGMNLSNLIDLSRKKINEHYNQVLNNNFDIEKFISDYKVEDMVNNFYIPYSSFLEFSSNENYSLD